jgi:hypothetical protein
MAVANSTIGQDGYHHAFTACEYYRPGLSLYLRQSLLLQRAAVVSLENYFNTSPQNIAQRHSR